MRAYLSRRYRFSASHRLHNEALGARQNLEVYGKCNNPHGHGHNYVVEVTVGGQVDEATGMVCNLVELDHCVHREVVDRFDRTNLNQHEFFAEAVPTTENLSIRIDKLLRAALGGAELVSIRVEETGNNSFEYSGGSGAPRPNIGGMESASRLQRS